ncbi:glycosyl hydrolase family 28-related protein [Listeria booriae]|uniref:Rhamnogalacturonase A/B/Epimerase-like pectate lyase domain-containing protein n=1 Tax=Listeria booriae TaxID=1552123 RepID=A0A7X0XR58_9LIST|nr:glycosyl hydrolase family 28-related protein [Listeria booriae]MBC1779164.1 hypothetical protein [Listeria booriae]
MNNFANIEDFGAIGDGSRDDAPEINLAIQSLVRQKGGILYIPAKTYAIGSELIIDYPGIYIRSASPYFSTIKMKSTFNGESAIVFKPSSRPKPDDYKLAKGVGIENGLVINCNNQNAHAITGIRVYDQASFRNVDINNVHKDYSGFYFVQEEDGYGQLGQTLLLENCFAKRAEGDASAPMYYFERYQEVNLVGCKSFASAPNPSNTNELKGDAYYLKDCRGFTFTGCSAAFSENAFVIEAHSRTVSGITITGQTNEAIAIFALKTMGFSSGFKVESITVLPIRNEVRKMIEIQPDGTAKEVLVSGGTFDIQNTTKALIYPMDASITLGTNSSQNVIFSTSSDKVVNKAIGNTVFGLANYTMPGISFLNALTLNEHSSVPTIYFADKVDANKSRIEQQSNNLRFGFRYDNSSGTKSYVNKLIILKNDLANATNIQVTYPDGANTIVRRIELGELNSAGEGYRQLRIKN